MDQPGNQIVLRGNQPGATDRMRELLARTVQDHFADQRSNAYALDDLRQQMEGLEWLVKEVREREIPGMTDRLDGLARHLDETTQKPPPWAESLAGHIEALGAQVAPAAELSSLRADIGAVSENVERALAQLQVVCDAIGQAVAALRAQDERLTRLTQSVAKLQQGMESAAGRFSRLDKAIAELTQRAGQLDKEISATREHAEAGFGALAAKADQSAEATARQVTQSMAAMAATVDGLAGQVSGVSGQVQMVHGRIERLDERMADADDKLGSLDTRLTSADGKIGSTDYRVAALDTRLERLDERLDDQYDRVNAIAHTLGGTDTKIGAIGSTLAATDVRIGVAEAALAAVDTKLGALDGRIERLDDRLAEHGRGLTSVDGKLGTVAGRLGPVDSKLKALDSRLGTVDGKVGALGGRLDGQLESLAGELRSRPAQDETQEALAKIVDAARNDVTTQLGSLEETVLTLAEALLRPHERGIGGPREGKRI